LESGRIRRLMVELHDPDRRGELENLLTGYVGNSEMAHSAARVEEFEGPTSLER
jgi:pyridoxal/pyridoxine/pyridoxamine kinase